MSQGATLCERLDWDSRFFGVSIARAVPSRVDLLTRDAILDWCRADGVVPGAREDRESGPIMPTDSPRVRVPSHTLRDQ